MTTSEIIGTVLFASFIAFISGILISAKILHDKLDECGIIELKKCEETREGKYKVEWHEIIVTENAIIKTKEN